MQVRHTTSYMLTGRCLTKIMDAVASPNAIGMVATLAHYSSAGHASTFVHRMQRAESIATMCGNLSDSFASKNAMPLPLLHICKDAHWDAEGECEKGMRY